MSSSSDQPDSTSTLTTTTTTRTENFKKLWIPIESDPTLMTNYLSVLTLSSYYLIDIPAIDEAESMGIFDGNHVVAYIFLYDELEDSIFETSGKTIDLSLSSSSNSAKKLFYMKQTAPNACGSIAMFHSFLNSAPPALFEPHSIIGKFYHDSLEKSPEERALLFEKNEEIYRLHHEFANQGQSVVPSGDELDKVKYHYVGLVWNGGNIVQLDGCKKGPIDHGECPKDRFRTEALQVIKKWLKPDCIHYSIVALCSA